MEVPPKTPRVPSLSYGHNVEFAWLMLRANRSSVRSWPGPTSTPISQYALKYGYDHEHGGLYSRGVRDEPASDTDKIWWVQAEMLAALTDALAAQGRPRLQPGPRATPRISCAPTRPIPRTASGWIPSLPTAIPRTPARPSLERQLPRRSRPGEVRRGLQIMGQVCISPSAVIESLCVSVPPCFTFPHSLHCAFFGPSRFTSPPAKTPYGFEPQTPRPGAETPGCRCPGTAPRRRGPSGGAFGGQTPGRRLCSKLSGRRVGNCRIVAWRKRYMPALMMPRPGRFSSNPRNSPPASRLSVP